MMYCSMALRIAIDGLDREMGSIAGLA